MVGCPAEVFVAISNTLEGGKQFLAQELAEEDFQLALNETLLRLQSWDPLTGIYPNTDPEWPNLADAYKHMAMIRILRFPDAFSIPCSDQRIRTSVAAILDASTLVPRHSPYFKRLLFPLFLAAAETTSPHQQLYVVMCVEHVKNMTGITYHSITELLEKTWQDRKLSDGLRNVPWQEYVSKLDWFILRNANLSQTCSIHLPRQHDYLFF